jgi:8-oxo-dGTP pyrophosphatase MutT (NUDIX family)
MKNLLIINEQDIVFDATIVDTASFRKREAVRAVVTDNAGKVALLWVGLYGYHKLPGGGIDEGEDMLIALERELLEEIGCRAKVTGEVGEIVEYRNRFELKQTSYCFVAIQVGEKGEPDFTDEELREQFSVVWADNIDGAINLLEQDEPTDYEGKFIKVRDLALLRATREIVS